MPNPSIETATFVGICFFLICIAGVIFILYNGYKFLKKSIHYRQRRREEAVERERRIHRILKITKNYTPKNSRSNQ